VCGCKYTPIKKARGYGPEIRQRAVQLYVDGMNLRRIGRQLRVNPQSVANWAKAHAEGLPAAPVPEQVENAELDELFTLNGSLTAHMESTGQPLAVMDPFIVATALQNNLIIATRNVTDFLPYGVQVINPWE